MKRMQQSGWLLQEEEKERKRKKRKQRERKRKKRKKRGKREKRREGRKRRERGGLKLEEFGFNKKNKFLLEKVVSDY